jgi:hypothetical protein
MNYPEVFLNDGTVREDAIEPFLGGKLYFGDIRGITCPSRGLIHGRAPLDKLIAVVVTMFSPYGVRGIYMALPWTDKTVPHLLDNDRIQTQMFEGYARCAPVVRVYVFFQR